MDAFNPFGKTATVTRSTVENLMDQVKEGKAFRMVGSDTKEGADKATIKALREGKVSAIQFGVSVGNGKGSTRLELVGDQIAEVCDALRAWDPSDDSPSAVTSLPPAECVRRTIVRETGDDGDMVVFKISLAKNSRTVRIPMSEWASFLDYMDRVGQWSEAAVGYYQAQLSKVEKG